VIGEVNVKVAETLLGNRMPKSPRATFDGLSGPQIAEIEDVFDRAGIPKIVDGTWKTWHFAKRDTGRVEGLLSGVGLALDGSSFTEAMTKVRDWFRLANV